MVTDYYLLKYLRILFLRFEVIRTRESFIWSAAKPPWQSNPIRSRTGPQPRRLAGLGRVKGRRCWAELLSLSQLLRLHRHSRVTIKSNATTLNRPSFVLDAASQFGHLGSGGDELPINPLTEARIQSLHVRFGEHDMCTR
ncbi:hypothetical protein FALCPG4_003407 [Fusarium falciforme]